MSELSKAVCNEEVTPEGGYARPQIFREEWDMIGYLCSHTLRDPVRRIEIHCEAMDKPDACEEVFKQTQHLHTCLSAMVEYMRMDIVPFKPTPVDTEAVVEGAMKSLEDKPYIKNAKIKYGELPDINGQKRRLIKLFSYLIDNACKFNESTEPVVNIAVVKENGMGRFTIEDNGIGLPDMDHHLLFMLLQRPELSCGYEGTGAGLALAKRIVEIHGGEIEIETTDNGARVNFTLPLAELV